MKTTLKTFLGGQKGKYLVLLAVFAIVCSSGAFAANGGIDILDSVGDKIIGLIGSKWVKAILAVALIVEFGVIAWGNSQGQGDIMKKVLPWVIGTAGILGATSIVNFFFSNVRPEALQGMIQVAESVTSLT